MIERDERWELASRAANEGIWDWDLRTNKVYRSDRWFELFGYEPGEIPSNSWAWEAMIHPDDASRVISSRRNHIEGLEERYYAEHRMRCKDGKYRWFLSRGQVIRDEEGTPVRMLGFYTSIEATVEIRECLMRRNAALTILHEVSLQAIGTEDHDVTLTYLLNRCREFMAADKAYLNVYEELEDVMRVHSLSGFVGPSFSKARRGEFLTGVVWETGEFQRMENFDQWPGRPPTSDSSQIKTAIGIPLKQGAETVGVITMGFHTTRAIVEDEINTLKQFAAIASLVLHNKKKALDLTDLSSLPERQKAEMHKDIRIDLLNSLLDGRTMSARDLSTQAKKCRFFDGIGYIAMVASGGEPIRQTEDASLNALIGPDLIVWKREGKIFLLFFGAKLAQDKRESIVKAEALRGEIEVFLRGSLCRIGVGIYCANLREITAAFRQACEAIEIGSRLQPQKPVHHYLDIALIQALNRQKDKTQVEAFMLQTLGKIIEHDQQKNSHLLETLTAILHEPSLRSAADALFIHSKTLLFRKNRIEEILGESLDDSVLRLNLLLSLQLHGLSDEMEIKMQD